MIDFFSAIGSFIMAPLYWVTSVILTGFHSVFGSVFGPASGWSWALSIVGLTLVIRALLIPLFVKQIKSSRNMQLLQPKVKELQKKYGHDRERLAQETMALYKETGTNPFASCLPILLQMPIFLALFRLLDQAAKERPKGVLSLEQARQFGESKIFGAHIADTFLTANGDWAVRFLAVALVLAMTATTFLTQRQLMSKNMPPDAMTGPYAQQQKMLLYVLPIVFAVSGLYFPVGVLIYWTTSNLWTMGQQFYVIRNNPAPGTPAAEAKARRDAHKAARKSGQPVQSGAADGVGGSGDGQGGGSAPGTATGTVPDAGAPARPVRQQPKRQPRSQRRGSPAAQPKAQSKAQSKAQPRKAGGQPTKKKRPGGR